MFDTLTRNELELSPEDGKTFRFYCCGPTVYGPAHIGNFRSFVVQDVLRRVIELGAQRMDVDPQAVTVGHFLTPDLFLQLRAGHHIG